MTRLTITALEQLVARGLERAGANSAMARSTAAALVAAEAEGMGSHGLFRVAQYAAHLRSGRVDGAAAALVVAHKPAACLVDAADGLAFPACELSRKAEGAPVLDVKPYLPWTDAIPRSRVGWLEDEAPEGATDAERPTDPGTHQIVARAPAVCRATV